MQQEQNLTMWRGVFVMSAKNIVFMININSENKKEYEYSISSWKYFCEKNNAMLFLLDKTVIDQSEMHIIFQRYLQSFITKDILI